VSGVGDVIPGDVFQRIDGAPVESMAEPIERLEATGSARR
jgi:hypothetical protein